MNIKIKQFYKDNLQITEIKGEQDATDFVRTCNIPTVSMKDPFINANQKLIIALINSFITNKKELFGSNKFIANSIGVSNPRSISNLLSDLESKGYIIREFADKSRRQRQLINFSNEFILVLHGKSGSDTLNNETNTLNNETHDTLNNEHTKQIYTKQITKQVLSKDNSNTRVENTTPLKPVEQKKQPDNRINELIDYLQIKGNLVALDGTQVQNRRYAFNILRKLKKLYPSQNELQLAKDLIDIGLSNQYMANNFTSMSYLFYNINKIIKTFQAKVQKNAIPVF